MASIALLLALAIHLQSPAPAQKEKPKFEMQVFQFVMLMEGPNAKTLNPEDASKWREHLKRLQ